jgi:hypothetical protein
MPSASSTELQRHDVGVVQRSDRLCFSREPSSTLGVVGQRRRQDFERNFAIERDVVGQIDVAHPTRADLVPDPVVADRVADQMTGDFRFGLPGAPSLYTCSFFGSRQSAGVTDGVTAFPPAVWEAAFVTRAVRSDGFRQDE